MLEGGVAGLAVPFLADDGILFDPSLIPRRHELGEVVAYELAYMLHPHWDNPGLDGDEEMGRFASKVAPMLLAKPPDYSMADVAALAPRRGTIRYRGRGAPVNTTFGAGRCDQALLRLREVDRRVRPSREAGRRPYLPDNM